MVNRGQEMTRRRCHWNLALPKLDIGKISDIRPQPALNTSMPERTSRVRISPSPFGIRFALGPLVVESAVRTVV